MNQLTQLNYVLPSSCPGTEKLYHLFPGILETMPVTNYDHVPGPDQLIEDARGRETEFSLQDQGFIYRSWAPVDVNWADESDVTSYVQQAKENFVSELGLGDSLRRCEVFDWRLRKADSGDILQDTSIGRMTKIKPSSIVHIDQTPLEVLDRLDLILSKTEKEDLLRTCRIQIFNVWRPISQTVHNWPLAVCDARTVTLDDLEELELLTKEKVRRSFLTKWSKHFRFYYLSNMTNEEVCIFKIFDSAAWDATTASENTLGCPHTAFNPDDVPTFPPRESVEVRFFVFSDR